MKISHNRKEIPTLTGVRGIAALWVVLFHLYQSIFGVMRWPPLSSIPQLQCGFLGVDLFFILSGFILCHVHNEDFKSYSPKEHLRFLKLRLSRIYPLHVVCLFGFLTVVLSLPDFRSPYASNGFTVTAFAATLLLIQNWGLPLGGYWNGPTWSLSAEWLAYIAFPFIVIGIRRLVPVGREAFLAFLVLLATLAAAFASHAPDLGGNGKLGVVRMATEFTGGCLISFSMRRESLLRQSDRILWLSIGIIGICVSDMRLHWGAIFGLAILVRSLATPGSIGTILFANPASVWLGKISFALYLSHWPLLQVFNWIMLNHPVARTEPARQILVMVLIFVIAASAVALWKLVEVPSRNYLRGYSKRPLQKLAPTDGIATG